MIAGLAVIRILIDCGAFVGTMLMKRNDAVLLADHEVREHRVDRQERKKAGDDAVPFHDPEQCAQHDVRCAVEAEA